MITRGGWLVGLQSKLVIKGTCGQGGGAAIGPGSDHKAMQCSSTVERACSSHTLGPWFGTDIKTQPWISPVGKQPCHMAACRVCVLILLHVRI